MSAPLESYIALPNDSGNDGKKQRVQTKTINAVQVQEHFVVPSPAYTLTGRYFFESAIKSISAAGGENGTTTGSLWFQNPVAATITAILRSLEAVLAANAATVAASAPDVLFQKFTFTGTASGAQEDALIQKTGLTANQLRIRSAMTGMTVSLVTGVIGKVVPPAILTAVGIYGGIVPVYRQDPQVYQRGQDLEIAPGEGIVVYQVGAGSTTDPRRFTVRAKWDEIDLT